MEGGHTTAFLTTTATATATATLQSCNTDAPQCGHLQNVLAGCVQPPLPKGWLWGIPNPPDPVGVRPGFRGSRGNPNTPAAGWGQKGPQPTDSQWQEQGCHKEAEGLGGVQPVGTLAALGTRCLDNKWVVVGRSGPGGTWRGHPVAVWFTYAE